ncbi:hypothetical protein Ga0609869_001009 [Rhodovulum iodosum]|uniref:Sulfotransferase family protein n=1 Tax=Rhodovulum iodosum TaxID=68291 RepID=A0ABV3XQP7_9RHOB|nr:sulfotransferase family 2 domain-containing protein [Rhodovulum robiginosum]RSK32915.1 hypothetical protein EJA01_11380 [Rhodovulum robiginosum]
MKLKSPQLYLSIPFCNDAYLYIRKNACSNFKRLIVETSEIQKPKQETALHFANSRYRISSVRHLRNRRVLCVVREPIGRIHSAFLNQFIQKLDVPGNNIRKQADESLSKPVVEATADDFFRDVVMARSDVDLHFLPQVKHMADVPHEIWPLERLHDRASEAWGDEIADRFFKSHVNYTSNINRIEGDYRSASIGELAQMLSEGVFPTIRSLLGDETHEGLRRMYMDDTSLHERSLEA